MIKIKREIIIMCVIVILIIGANFGLDIYTKNTFEQISGQLNSLENRVLDEIDNMSNSEENQDKQIIDSYVEESEKIQSEWRKKYDLYACFIEHDELEKVELQMVSIKASFEIGDFRKAVDEIERCRFLMKHIEEKDSLRLVNVF